MARVPRSLTVLPNFSVHKIWRGHNREWNLATDDEKLKYLEFLNEDIERENSKPGAHLQALTLMSNHEHEISRVTNPRYFSNHMRRHHSRYGAYFNRKYNRCGKVAQDRPKTCLIETDRHEMTAVFYIHANPIRAKIVRDAKNYRWSTHRLYAYGQKESWMRNIVFPSWYLALGKTMKLRQRKYRSLFDKYLRQSGRRRRTFLKRHFFGSYQWMKRLDGKISAWRKARPPP